MLSEVWNIRLLGGFRVEAPSGAEIGIVSRKAKALVALLALNDGIAISRESLGGYLWPDKPRESQQQNLRQAVKDVRRAFAPVDALLATREVCRLALEDFTCDAAECLRSGKDAGNLILLPEMTEPVFDTYRTELASYAPTGERGEAVKNASWLLEWTLAREPSRVLEMLHAFRDLIPNLPLPQLEATLRKGLAEASAADPRRGWASAQFALVLMWAGRFEEGVVVAKVALNGSRPETDPASWAAAASTAGFFMILRGRLEAADKLLSSALTIAESHGLRAQANTMRHAQALRLAYGGDISGAIALLEKLDRTILIESHHATGLANVGLPEKARMRLDAARSLVDEDTDARIKSQIDTAEGYLLLAEGKPDEARSIFRELIPTCEALGMRLIGIHALEGLALAESDPTAAKALVKHVTALRERFGLPLLPGDRIRLARILFPGATTQQQGSE